MSWILKVDNVSKIYRLGSGATQRGTLYEQLAKRLSNYLPKKKIILPETLEKPSIHTVVSEAQMEGLSPGHFWALKDVSFQINPGERIGLIGQNGSGKSTLLKILSRITAQSHGEFRYKGHLISLLEVGTGFHPELTGRENIYLNSAINGISRQQIKARFKEMVDFSELGGQIDTPVKRYSSGMYMRLAFSVAAFLESEILLVDEVLAVGDQGFQKKCKEKMLEVANDGRSLIFVSHDMSAIESICKKTIEISHGKIVAIKDIAPKEEQKAPPLPLEIRDYNNTTVALHTIKLFNQAGLLQETFTVNEDILIETTFSVLKPQASFVVRIDLSSAEGVLLFSSFDRPSLSRKKGLYKETLTIPKETLNAGHFKLSVLIIEEKAGQTLACMDCLPLQITEDWLPIGARGNWKQAWPNALLRPNLGWNIEYYEDSKVKEEA